MFIATTPMGEWVTSDTSTTSTSDGITTIVRTIEATVPVDYVADSLTYYIDCMDDPTIKDSVTITLT